MAESDSPVDSPSLGDTAGGCQSKGASSVKSKSYDNLSVMLYDDYHADRTHLGTRNSASTDRMSKAVSVTLRLPSVSPIMRVMKNASPFAMIPRSQSVYSGSTA